jgi:hypothetical protein
MGTHTPCRLHHHEKFFVLLQLNPAFLIKRVNESVARVSWTAVARVSRPTPDSDYFVTECANGIDERGFALAARTPPVQPTRRSALLSVDLAARNEA